MSDQSFVWTGRSDAEDGPHARRMHQALNPHARRAVLGFACDAGVIRNQGRPGAAQGPKALRAAMANLACPADFQGFHDAGDVRVDDAGLEDGQAKLAAAVAAQLQTRARVVVFGGGHETAVGSFAGLRAHAPDARIGIINVDAHLDLRAPGPAGPSSGTPFYQIRQTDPARFDYLCVGVAREANTQALFERAAAWGVGVIEDRVLANDPDAANVHVDALLDRNELVYLSLCLDALPGAQAPGVSAPAARGVALTTVERLIDRVLSHGKPVPVCDVVELCPPQDRDGLTAKVAAFLARRLLLG